MSSARSGRDEGAATLWVLTSPEVNRLLRDAWDWDEQRYAAWLRTMLERALLPSGGTEAQAEPDGACRSQPYICPVLCMRTVKGTTERLPASSRPPSAGGLVKP